MNSNKPGVFILSYADPQPLCGNLSVVGSRAPIRKLSHYRLLTTIGAQTWGQPINRFRCASVLCVLPEGVRFGTMRSQTTCEVIGPSYL